MILSFRPIKVWPEGWQNPHRKRAPNPFKSKYQATLQLLDTELRHLAATDVTLQVAASERDMRLDGQLRADAKVTHPGVIVTIDTKKLGTLVYPCDAFESRWHGDGPSWQANLRAVALGLEALRKVERYGIAERGQQYAGYREIGGGPIELGRGNMTREDAARVLLDAAGEVVPIHTVLDNPEVAADLYRRAAKLHHPDAGGSEEAFKLLSEAWAVLDG